MSDSLWHKHISTDAVLRKGWRHRQRNRGAHVTTQTTDPAPLPGWQISAFAAIACVSIAGISFGLGLPLLAFNLEFMTHSGTVIGLNALMGALSTIVIAPFAPAILARVPTRPFLIACLLYASLSYIAYPLVRNVPFWMFLRFTSGLCISMLFVTSEAWMVQMAPAPIRGRVLGLYSMALAVGFGLGGLLVALLGVRGWTPFLTGAGLSLVAVLPLLLPGPGLHLPHRAHSGLAQLWRLAAGAPRLMTAALAFGAIETAAAYFTPIWAYRAGYGEVRAQALVAVGAFGVILLQLPLSWLGDHINRYRLMLVCGLTGLLAPALMLAAGLQLSWWLYPVFFVYVGVTEGLYILGLAQIGARYAKADITGASAALVTMYGLGSLLGPLLTGPLMDAINPHGAMLGLALIGLIYPLAALLRAVKGPG